MTESGRGRQLRTLKVKNNKQPNNNLVLTKEKQQVTTWVFPIVGLDGSTISSGKKPIFSSGWINYGKHLILTSSM
jgi:hypothetical protein